MKEIGYWKTSERAPLKEQAQEVYESIEPGWVTSQAAKVCIAYMKAGTKVNPQLGCARHRVTREELGCYDMISPDSKWRYPELWWVYIEGMSVRPNSEEFIQDALTWYKEYHLRTYLRRTIL